MALIFHEGGSKLASMEIILDESAHFQDESGNDGINSIKDYLAEKNKPGRHK